MTAQGEKPATTVFVVTSGEYSDYGIDAIYSTREKAEAHVAFCAATFSGDPPKIEEWDMDVLNPPSSDGRKPYTVRMDRQGNTHSVYHQSGSAPVVEDKYLNFAVSEPLALFHDRPRYRTHYVMARDEAHAVKIANEQRTRLIAENRWDEPVDVESEVTA